MIGQDYTYYQPWDKADLAALLGTFGAEAVLIGGGTMVVPMLVRGQVAPKAVIGMNAMQLNDIVDEGDAVTLGAMTSYTDILRSKIVADRLPVLREMAEQVTGGASIQNQGTIGGSLSFANPASDAPSCLTVLNGVCELQYAGGVRPVAITDFLQGAFLTSRRSDEFLARVRIPVAEPTAAGCYYKHKFCTSSWPIVAAACTITTAGARPVLRLSVGAASPRPTYRTVPFEAADLKHPMRWAEEIGRTAAADIVESWSDELADGDYRRAVVAPVVKRSVLAAVERLGL
jgi:carbon-monoxide dehydrogenase medium subunit